MYNIYMYTVPLIIINTTTDTNSKNYRLRDTFLTTLTFIKGILLLTSRISLIINYFIEYKLVLRLGLI